MILTRRQLLAAAVVAAVRARPAGAQPPTTGVQVGVLWPGRCPLRAPRLEAFRRGLSDAGYVDGQNVTIHVRCAEEHVADLPRLAAHLADQNVRVIASIGVAATRAAQATTRTIPIVALADDLVKSGVVASLARPGGNITGVQILGPEVTAKRLEMLKQLVPSISRVAVFLDPDQKGLQLAALESAARGLGLELQMFDVRNDAGVKTALEAAVRARAQAVHVGASPLLFALSKTVIALSAAHRLPSVYEWREAVESGGLASYGPVLSEMWRQTAVVVGKILNGAKPAEVPIEQPSKFELVINVKTARTLGLTIPPSLLARADQIIE